MNVTEQLPSGGMTLSFETVVQVIARLKSRLYPWIHILRKSDGTVVVTISHPPKGHGSQPRTGSR